jgi:hypothetical protein
MLSSRTHEMRTAWQVILEQMRSVRDARREVAQLRAEVSRLSHEARTQSLAQRVDRLERVNFRQDGWWKKEPRIEAFVRKSVAELRNDGFSDMTICSSILLGLSTADLATIPRAA